MQLFSTILQTLQVLSSILVIVLVLLQQGKGADMGAAFGSGSAGSVFGAAGAANFLSRATKWVAILFFATTGGLAWIAHHPSGSPLDSGIMQGFTTSSSSDSSAGSGSSVPDLDASVPVVPGPAAEGQQGAVDLGAGNQSVPALSGDASVPVVPGPDSANR